MVADGAASYVRRQRKCAVILLCQVEEAPGRRQGAEQECERPAKVAGTRGVLLPLTALPHASLCAWVSVTALLAPEIPPSVTAFQSWSQSTVWRTGQSEWRTAWT